MANGSVIRIERDGLLTIDHVTEFFPSLKERHAFGWDLHGVTRFRITPFAWITVAYTKTPKATQLHFIPLAQRLSNTIEQNINYSLSLLFSKLNRPVSDTS
jgi:hypothetical protein